MNDTIKNIKSRRSVRVYKPELIKDEELNTILEAGLYAPSAMNAQPWHLTVVQNPDILRDINADAKAAMAVSDNDYVRKYSENEAFNILYHAPTAVIVSAGSESPYSVNDCAALTQNMLVAAESINVGSCWVGLSNFALKGEKGPEYKTKLGIPEGYEPCFTVVLGYKKTSGTGAPERKVDAVNYVK